MKKYLSLLACAVVALLLFAGLFAVNRARQKQMAANHPFQAERAPSVGTNTPATITLWTQFRGVDQGRCSPEQAVPLIWSETTNVVWKTPVRGTGFSSPVISEDKIWLTTALDEGRSLRALAFDKAGGSCLIDNEVFSLSGAPAKHAVNSHASPTPLLDREHVYVAFGTHGIACLHNSDGRVLWRNTDLKFDDEKMGGGASPVLSGDLVIIHCDGTDERFIAALNRLSGQVAWKVPRSNPSQAIPTRKAFSTPVLHELNGTTQLISSSSFGLFGYDPLTGRELWSVETPGFCPVPVPLVHNDWIFLCTGYNKAQLYGLHASTPGQPPQVVWKATRSVPLVPSPVLVKEHIYMVSDNGVASCLEAATGRMVWNERIGGTYWASLLASGERLYCFAEDGTTTVLAASAQFHVVAKNRLEGQIMATPAAADSALFVRTKTHLYRLQTKVAVATISSNPSPPSSLTRPPSADD